MRHNPCSTRRRQPQHHTLNRQAPHLHQVDARHAREREQAQREEDRAHAVLRAARVVFHGEEDDAHEQAQHEAAQRMECRQQRVAQHVQHAAPEQHADLPHKRPPLLG
jgi:hypothetical protein